MYFAAVFDDVCQVHPKFLSSVSTCCLYIAAKASEPPVLTASLHNLLLLGQCGGSLADLIYTERLIVELLGTEVMESAATCSPLAFLRMFHDILLVDLADGGRMPALDLSLLVSKLEVIICQFDFTRFHVSPASYLMFFECFFRSTTGAKMADERLRSPLNLVRKTSLFLCWSICLEFSSRTFAGT